MKIENPTMEQVKNFVKETTMEFKQRQSKTREFGHAVSQDPIRYIFNRRADDLYKEFYTPSALYKAIGKRDVVIKVYSDWDIGGPFITVLCA